MPACAALLEASGSANAEDDSGAERTIPSHKFLIWVCLVVASVSILLADFGNRFTTRFKAHGELRVALGTNAQGRCLLRRFYRGHVTAVIG